MTMFFELGDYGEDDEFYFDDDQKVRCPKCDSENVKHVADNMAARTVLREQMQQSWYRCQDCNYWWSES